MAVLAGGAGWLGVRHVENDLRRRSQDAVQAIAGADGHGGKDALLAVVDGRDITLVGQAEAGVRDRAVAALAGLDGVRRVSERVSVDTTTTTTTPATATTTTRPVRRPFPQVLRPPLADGLVRARVAPGQVVLEGTLPDDQARQRLLNGLKRLDRWIVDATSVGTAGDAVRVDLLARFARAVDATYDRLESGTLVLSGDQLVVSGRTREQGQRDDVIARVRSISGRWTVIDALVDALAPRSRTGNGRSGEGENAGTAPTTTAVDFLREDLRAAVQDRVDELLADNAPEIDERGTLTPVTGLLLEEAVVIIIQTQPTAVRVLVNADAAKFAGDFQARQWSQRRAEIIADGLRARGLVDARLVPIGLGLDAATPKAAVRLVLTYPQVRATTTTTTAATTALTDTATATDTAAATAPTATAPTATAPTATAPTATAPTATAPTATATATTAAVAP